MAIDVAAPANQWVVKGMPESVTIQGVRVHVFPDTVMCYNDTQVREDIKDGDVLVVPSDEIVGILVEAWPTAITAHYGELHRFRAVVHENRCVAALSAFAPCRVATGWRGWLGA